MRIWQLGEIGVTFSTCRIVISQSSKRPIRRKTNNRSGRTVELSKIYRILIMGASYGSLLATKLVLAGHNAHLICLPAEADLINAEGAIVRMPVRGRDGLVEVNSRALRGTLTAGGTAGVDPAQYDLVVLAMQEPQYRSAGVRELLQAVATSRTPCMSIMNMPPLPYLKRIAGIDATAR